MKLLQFYIKPISCSWPFLVALFLIQLYPLEARAQSPGGIRGVVLDAEQQSPLPGATIMLMPEETGTTTDLDGVFRFDDVAAGAYTLRVSYVGFEARFIPDIIVHPGRTIQVNVSLSPAIIEGEELVITAGYFTDRDDAPVSLATFSAEEIRRAAGAGGDISRIISGLPSLARVDDMQNSLVVRGGNPMENGFYVDNIEIPNINHFPTQGSSGGPIGLINVDLIEDVSFSAGGFSAAYGNRLSSVMDLTLREGNREEIATQLDFNFAGVGVVTEGGFSKQRGSWLVSARRSYLDFLINTVFEDEAGAALPAYSDYQVKLVYDLNKQHQLTLLAVAGFDKSEIKREDALDVPENYYGVWKNIEHTTGLNWRYLWKGAGVSNTSFSHGFTRYNIETSRTASEALVYANESTEHHFRVRNANYVKLGDTHHVDFGADLDVMDAGYEHIYEATIDPLGEPVPGLLVDDGITAARAGAFVSYRWKPSWRYALTTGLRMDYFSFTGGMDVSPRLSMVYQLSARTSLNMALGQYAQHLPLVLLSQNDAFSELRHPLARQIVVGIKHDLREDTRLSIEGYFKDYRRFPMNPDQPALFIIDQLFYQQSGYLNQDMLTDNGRADARGVEVMVQKKMADKLYGLVSGVFFQTRYRGEDDVWRNRVFDNRYIFAAEGGYKPNRQNEFSIRWTYAGGRPYTPFDVATSTLLGTGVFDETRINDARMPAYHSLNLRYDRRFFFKRRSMVAFLSVWNVYGRRNVASYSWNEVENERETISQWGTLPIFGLELNL